MAALYQFSLNGDQYCRIELPVCASSLQPDDAALLLEYLELVRRQLQRAIAKAEQPAQKPEV